MLIKNIDSNLSENSARISGRRAKVNSAESETCFKLGLDPHSPLIKSF